MKIELKTRSGEAVDAREISDEYARRQAAWSIFFATCELKSQYGHFAEQ
jgi:hypothetical protein